MYPDPLMRLLWNWTYNWTHLPQPHPQRAAKSVVNLSQNHPFISSESGLWGTWAGPQLAVCGKTWGKSGKVRRLRLLQQMLHRISRCCLCSNSWIYLKIHTHYRSFLTGIKYISVKLLFFRTLRITQDLIVIFFPIYFFLKKFMIPVCPLPPDPVSLGFLASGAST